MPRRIDIDREVLHDLYYNKQMTQKEIWIHLGVTRKVVENNMKRYGMKGRRTGPQRGERHPGWKGGRTVGNYGYIRKYAPDHPFASGKYVLEHRLVMEQKIGRYLQPGEVVHHIDGNTSNNHPDNLELFSKNSDHLSATLKGKCPKWTEGGRRRTIEGIRRSRGRTRKRKPLPVPVEQFELMCRTMMTKDIAIHLGVSKCMVERWMKRHGIAKTRVRVYRQGLPTLTPIAHEHRQHDAA